MFSGDEKAQAKAAHAFVDLLQFRKSPLDVVPDEVLLEWCDRDPAVRYPLMAASATLFRRPKDGEPHEWTPLASRLLAGTPDPRRVFKEIVQRLHPTSWSGSLATTLESRLKLLEQLPLNEIAGLEEALNEAKGALRKSIDVERKYEADEDRSRSWRFE